MAAVTGPLASVAGPNFLIVGAAKAGTTSLCHYLREHPDVFVAREKESHFFLFQGEEPSFAGPGDDEEFNKLIISDEARYAACFAGAGSSTARGEASVYYLYEPLAIERALAYDPAMKFVAVLRDPPERAFSAYSHMVRDGREPETEFRAAFAAEAERTAANWSYGFRYDSVGRYAGQLEEVFRRVPAEQLHVLLYEDLATEPGATLSALFAFLGVRDRVIDSRLVLNASGRPRLSGLNTLLTRRNPLKEGLKKVLPYRLGSSVAHQLRNWNLRPVEMAEPDRLLLRDSYAADVEAVSELLRRDLSRWREPAAH